MKLKERISWLMGTIQQSLFPNLEECLPSPFLIAEHIKRYLSLINGCFQLF